MSPEKRVRPATVRVERRAAEGGAAGEPAIVGHAAVFDVWTTLYDGKYFRWRELIRPGAFKNAIAEKQDVRALFNHDSNFILGRTKSGTLTLEEDKVGLLTRTSPPDTQTVRDMVLTPMERGDVDGMSFAFSVRDGDTKTVTDNKDGSRVTETAGQRVTQRYEGDCYVEEREILDADLFDVSPVVYPAYDGTDVAFRSVAGVEARAKEMDRPHPKRDGRRLRRAAARLRLAESDV